MRAILIRHYRTKDNEADRIIGWGDSPPVSSWLSDIDHIKSCLRKNGIKIDRIQSSDLKRSRRTAEAYAKMLGISRIDSAAELNEINYGTLQGKYKSWASSKFPRHKKDPDLVYPKGESFRQMQQRSVDYLLRLAKTRRGQTVLIVGHAGIIRGIVCHFLKLDFAANLKRKVAFRYIGDLTLAGGRCQRYDEPGEISGFASSGQIDLPYRRGKKAD